MNLKPQISQSWQQLIQQANALLEGSSNRISNAANLSALIFQELEDVSWAGFYFLTGGKLMVGPFQGNPACVSIEIGQGVCGVAAVTREIQRVGDVHEFEGHIACDVAARSEIVVPLVKNGELIGVMDVDSRSLDRFSEEDGAGFAELAAVYIRSIV